MDSAAEFLRDAPKELHYLFDVVHFILCIQGDRDDMGESFHVASRTNPLASWFSSMMACFAGGILVSPLCGEPILSAFNDSLKVAIATLLWFLICYTPQDLSYQVIKLFPVKLVLYAVKAMYYPKKVLAGMKHAEHVLPGNILAMLIIAVCKGNGSGVLKPACRLVRGVWRPLSNEFITPSITTKYCLVACLVFYLAPGDLTYVAIAALFLSMKVGPLLGVPVDLFTPLENTVCPLVLGAPDADNKKKQK